jgi:hypothetical protein
MFIVENLIRNASRSDKDNLSILVVNEGFDDYISLLANGTNHNFYIVNGMIPNVLQWSSKETPSNVYVYNSIDSIPEKYIDAIICFNRGKSFDVANEISHQSHIPLIVVDFCSSMKLIPLAVSSRFDIPDNEKYQYFLKKGEACVGIDELVKRTWIGQVPSLAFDIPFPFYEYSSGEAVARNKILVDNKMPPEFIRSLNLDGNIFTVNPSEAIAYMHLWQTKTPMLYRCMSSRIPTLVFDEKEFSDLLNKKTCILSNNLSESLTRKGIEAFLSSKYLSETTEKAYNYMLENTLENFSEKWNNILYHVCNKPIIRG